MTNGHIRISLTPLRNLQVAEYRNFRVAGRGVPGDASATILVSSGSTAHSDTAGRERTRSGQSRSTQAAQFVGAGALHGPLPHPDRGSHLCVLGGSECDLIVLPVRRADDDVDPARLPFARDV